LRTLRKTTESALRPLREINESAFKLDVLCVKQTTHFKRNNRPHHQTKTNPLNLNHQTPYHFQETAIFTASNKLKSWRFTM
jgi:hypothetical protein